MREILFRGKNNNGEWVYGWLGHLHCYDSNTKEISSVYFTEISNDLGCRLNTIVDYKTVGQYTGLTDKNGTKIFEGDVVRCKYANAPANEHIQKVVFLDGKFMAEFSAGGCYAELYDGARHFSFDKSVYMTEIEVIGNIHDNPELLKGGADNGN